MNNITAIIITFYRHEFVINCVKSLRANYPQIKVIVANNAPESKWLEKQITDLGAEYYQLEFNCGVCKARNFLVSKVKTDYILVGDDDFEYTKWSNIGLMLAFLNKHSKVDLIGGRLFEQGRFRDYQGFINFKDKYIKYTKHDERYQYDGIIYAKVELVMNFFLARTKMLKANKWDEDIKVVYEHEDWFIGLKKKDINIVYSPQITVIHKPLLPKVTMGDYGKYRFNRDDSLYFFKKHNIDCFFDFYNNKGRPIKYE